MYTVVCAFDDHETALCSITHMIHAGLPRDDIHVQPDPDSYVDVSPTQAGESHDGERTKSRLSSIFARLVGCRTPGTPGTYRDAVRRGSTVVVVHVANAQEARRASDLMAANGAFDVEQRLTEWKFTQDIAQKIGQEIGQKKAERPSR